MLLHHDGQPRADPVRRDGQEILEDAEEMVAPGDGQGELDHHDDETPEPAGDRFRVPAEHLNGICRRVAAGRVVGDGAECEDDDAESAEAAEALVRFEEEGAGGDAVGLAPGRDDGDASCDADAEDVAEDERKPGAAPGHEECDRFGGGGRIVDVEVGGHGGEADDAREFEGEERAAVCGHLGVAADRDGVCIEVLTG